MSRKEKWFSEFGVIDNPKYLDEYMEMVEEFKKIIRRLEGRVSYRDLYDIGRDVSYTAVGQLVCDRVNAQERLRQDRRRKKKKR